MNRYPWWKYAVLALALVVGFIYTLPNFFGEAPAVQVSSAKATIKVDSALESRVAQVLSDAQLSADYIQLEGNSVKARFGTTDAQLKAKDALSKALNTDPADPTFIIALNLVSRSPQWLTSLHALPMYLGLDLRGGVHFLMQVDMKAALEKKAESMTGDVRTALRDKNIRHSGISRSGNAIVVNFRDEPTRQQALALLNYRGTGRSLLARGVCEARNGEWAAAEHSLSKAFELDPANPAVSMNLAEVLYHQQQYERARFYARRINAQAELVNAQSLWLELRIERKLNNGVAVEDLSQQLRRRFTDAVETQRLREGRFDE